MFLPIPVFSQPPLSIPTARPTPSDSTFTSFRAETDIEKLWQHIVMFLGAIVLGFCLGNTSISKKNKDLKYKLNRILREIDYHQSKQ
jgi:hypothetical protein